MRKLNKRAQSSLEYTILIIVLLGAMIAVQFYIKRGLQGRWKAAVDDLGDQYDPRVTNSCVKDISFTDSVTYIQSVNLSNQFFTSKIDISDSIGRKLGADGVQIPYQPCPASPIPPSGRCLPLVCRSFDCGIKSNGCGGQIDCGQCT